MLLQLCGLVCSGLLVRMPRLLAMLVAIGLASDLSAQVALSLASGSGSPGSTVNLNLSVTTTGATLPSGLQWDVSYAANDISSITFTIDPRLAANKQMSCGAISNTQLRCILFGFNQTTITNGVVATAAVALSSGTTSTSTAISISNQSATDANGLSITPATASGGTISISQGGGGPLTIPITVTTNPVGLTVVIDGNALPSPQTFQWAIGSTHSISTPSPQGSGTRYVIGNWSDGGALSHIVTALTSTTILATFAPQYLLTASANGGTVTRSPASSDGYYNPGTPVSLTATPNSGQQFSSWSGDAAGTSNPVTVNMSAPRNVTANFTGSAQSFTVTTNPPGIPITVDGNTLTAPQTFQWAVGSVHTIGTTSPQVSGGARGVFANWSDGGALSHTITASAGTTYTANFTIQYLLTTAASGGTISAIPASPGGDGFYNSGTVVQLTANASSGRQFSSWSGDATGSTNPTSVSMTAQKTVTANFTSSAQSFTVNTSPSSLSIVVDGVGYTSPQTFQWTPGSNHTIGTAGTQGSGSSRYVFASWSDGGAVTHTVAPSSPAAFTATFNLQFLLTTSAGGGAIVANPSSQDGFYNNGTAVQLTANASAGNQFSSWSGDVSGSANPVTVTMNAPRNVIANFPSSAQGITVATNPAGQSVVVDGVSLVAPQTFQWTAGSNHTLSVPSPQGTGNTKLTFQSWSDGGAQTHNITTPSNSATYTVNLARKNKLTTSASGGTITALPASPTGDGFYDAGTAVQLSANASSGNQFSSWSGDITGSTNPITIALDVPRNVVANFTSSDSYTVTTNPAGLTIIVDGVSTPSPKSFQWTSGSSHTIGVTPTQGSGGTRNVFAGWTDNGAVTHTVTASGPATYSAHFTTQYLLSTSITPANSGTVGANPASLSGDGFYNSGTLVQLTATPTSGQQFSSWSGDAAGSASPAVISMTAPRNVTATFSGAQGTYTVTTNPSGLSITVDGASVVAPKTFQWAAGSTHTISTTPTQGSGSTRNQFNGWSDGGAISHVVTATAATTYIANFLTQYKLTTSATGGFISAVPASPTGDGFYNSGQAVVLTATPNSGQQFSSWSGDAGGSTSPVTVVMNAERNVTANFSSAPQSFTVATNPPAMSITVDGAVYTAPQTFQWTAGSSHTIATSSLQSAVSTRNVFSNWSDGGALSHTITASAGTTYIANFSTQHHLTTSASGGTIAVAPPSSDGFYASGTNVTLTANASPGNQFTSWSGDASGSTNPLSVSMNAPRTISANFPSITGSYTINTNPSGLSFTVDGTPYLNQQSFQWSAGTSHSISVATQGTSGTRYVFANWSDGGAQSHSVTATTPTNITVNFTTQYQLSVVALPAGGGSMQISPSSGDGFYNSGSNILLTPIPTSSYRFSSWSGDLSGPITPAGVFFNGPKSIVANFTSTSNAPTGSCKFILSRSSFSIASEGDLSRVDVATDPNCQWTSSNNVPWIVVNNPSGTGSGSLNFTVTPNPGSSLRTASLNVAGQNILVSQASSACAGSLSTSSASNSVPAAGSSIAVNVTSQRGCEWSASVAPADWLNLAAGSVGAADGAVQTIASANPSGSFRTGSITVGGQTTKLLQFGGPSAPAFADVAADNIFNNYITVLRDNNVTNGCNPGIYCPDNNTTRGEMAAFIIRSLYGETFPFPQTPYFSDVTPAHTQFKYIQKMREQGFTVGCTTTTYCPGESVTRGQMAVFLVRARLGIASGTNFPFPNSGYFGDVSTINSFYPFIQKLKQMGFTAGCTATTYCPDNPTTRGQMAVFLIRAFFTP